MRIFKKLKLGVIGHGFVGKATDWGFNKKVEKFIVDPKYSTDINQLAEFRPNLIFVCVPTPMGNDGNHDSVILESVVKELTDKCKESIIVIKSTVLPSVLKKLAIINKKIIYNPEFLREKHANKDFANSEMIIFGGDKNTALKVSKYYLLNSRCKTKEHVFVDLLSASLIKYTINTFLASKVIFFNELYDLCKKLELEDSWETMIEIISIDKRIGPSHMNVPGHDGKFGFGGACFPKDSTALVKFAENLGVELSILKKSIKTNNKIRSKYRSLDDREKEQNVSFDDKI